jgi:hypothetical protein
MLGKSSASHEKLFGTSNIHLSTHDLFYGDSKRNNAYSDSLKGGRSLVLLPSLLVGSILLDLSLPLYGLDIPPLLPCQVQCQSTQESAISSFSTQSQDKTGTHRITATSAIKM